jgi:hypothetical protein
MKSFQNKLWLLLFAGLLGCDSPAERLVKEQIAVTNEAADRIEKGTFSPVYAQELWDRTQVIMKRQQKLKLPPDEKKQLEDKYRPEMERAEARLKTAMEKNKTAKHSSPNHDAGPPTASEASKPGQQDKVPTEGSHPDDGKQEEDKKPPS